MHLLAVQSKEVEGTAPVHQGVMRNELEEALSSSQRRCRPDRPYELEVLSGSPLALL